MAYTEQMPSRKHVGLLLLFFLILYTTCLGVRELRSHEAMLATAAAEMSAGGSPVMPTVHGERVHTFPVYPWLVSLCSALRRPNEWSARLPAALATLLMSLLSGLMARRAGGKIAGVVAAAMVLSSPICLREGPRAGSEPVFAVFLSAAWFAWYRFGVEERKWGVAWAAAVLLVTAATMTVGVRAIACFYLPLFCLRDPLRGWRRMLVPAHFAMLVFLIVALALWSLVIAPGQTLLPWNTLVLGAVPTGTQSYVKDILQFPIKCAGYLLPWTFLAWPAFCLAYRPLERGNVAFRYLRTIVVSLFLAAWFLPGISARALLPLICPLAVLTGLHYEILVRRHYSALLKLHKLMLALALAAALACVGVCCLHLAGIIVFAEVGGLMLAFSMLLAILAAVLVCWLGTKGATASFWARLVLGIVALRLVVFAVATPWHVCLHSEARATGAVLAGAVPEGATVYRAYARRLVCECFYLRRPVVRVVNVDEELPAAEAEIYVLTGVKPPIVPTRAWTACSPGIDLRRRPIVRVTWFPGGRCLVRMQPGYEKLADVRRFAILRMYRGVLLP